MHEFQQVNTRKFFKATGLHMKFEGTAATMSHETIMKRIEDTEKNYELQGEAASLDHLIGIIAARKFKVNYDEENIVKHIKSLQKVDTFFQNPRGSASSPDQHDSQAH